MVRLLTILCFATLLGACEDGPNDPYKPSNAQNNGANGTYSDTTTASLDASFPGRSAQQICSDDERAARWAVMVNEPIIPPRVYAGIDMAKDDTWEGITIEEAEHINCQATNLGEGGSCWGNNCEVDFFYDVTTHIVEQMELNLGYQGLMKFTSRDGAHHYEMGIGKITKDNSPFLIHFQDPGGQGALDVTELMDAALATFSPTSAPLTGSCADSGQCLYLPDAGDGTGIIGFRPISVYFIVPDPLNLPPAIASKPKTIYNFYTKLEPYSSAPLTLKIDAEGPVAEMMVGPAANIDCRITLGLTWSDFLANCINVAGNATDNTTNYNKLIGGRLHDLTHWVFSTGQWGGIAGVNINYSSSSNDPNFYIGDHDLPQPADTATSFIFDVRASSQVSNDIDGSGNLDFHGTSRVVLEYLRTAQATINSMLPPGMPRHELGDPDCFGPDSAKADGCTGLEGYIIPGSPVGLGATPGEQTLFDWSGGHTPTDIADPSHTGGDVNSPYAQSFLIPGDPAAYICDDPINRTGCVPANAGIPAPLWDTAFRKVREVLGHGDLYSLPVDVQDRRFFFKMYTIALARYMRAAGETTMPANIHDEPLDMESLFFDVSDGLQFDKLEYVDRSVISPTHPFPIDFEYGSDVKQANQRYTNFYGRLDREEAAMYAVMAEDKTAVPGSQNNLQVTNLAGTKILPLLYPGGIDHRASDAPISGWRCAWDKTAIDNNDIDCSGNAPPMADADRNGNAYGRLKMYRGAWEPGVFAIGSDAIIINEEDLGSLSAKITIPNFVNPYDQTSDATPYEFRVDYTPPRPDTGLAVPINGQRDLWVTAGQFYFEGVTTTITVDWRYEMGADGMLHAKIIALETQDFLGEAFMCVDNATGDILGVHMYDSGQSIVQWLDSHPGSRDDCGIIVRNSPFNNYPDFITSSVYGVKVNMSEGGGFGRVTDVTLYDPTIATSGS